MNTIDETDVDSAMAEIINAFLRWPLPDTVASDLCCNRPGKGRTGTNLLTLPEAAAMAQDVVRPAVLKLLKEYKNYNTVAARLAHELNTNLGLIETEYLCCKHEKAMHSAMAYLARLNSAKAALEAYKRYLEKPAP